MLLSIHCLLKCKCFEVNEMRCICWWTDTWKTLHLYGIQNKQTVRYTFCKIGYCFILNQQTWCMAEKQNNYGINIRVHSIITRRATGRGMPSASLSSKEQREPHSHEAWCCADNLNTYKVGRFTFDLTKVYGSSGQRCGLDGGNCQTL